MLSPLPPLLPPLQPQKQSMEWVGMGGIPFTGRNGDEMELRFSKNEGYVALGDENMERGNGAPLMFIQLLNNTHVGGD